jgi:hypothetical protein
MRLLTSLLLLLVCRLNFDLLLLLLLSAELDAVGALSSRLTKGTTGSSAVAAVAAAEATRTVSAIVQCRQEAEYALCAAAVAKRRLRWQARCSIKTQTRLTATYIPTHLARLCWL